LKINDLEIIESYEVRGKRRFRIYSKKAGVIVNVEAKSEDEALHKAIDMLKSIGII